MDHPWKNYATQKMLVTKEVYDSVLYQNVQNREIYRERVNLCLLRAGGRGKEESYGEWLFISIGFI